MCPQLGRVLATFASAPKEFAFVEMISSLECALDGAKRKKGKKGQNGARVQKVKFFECNKINDEKHSLEVCMSRTK